MKKLTILIAALIILIPSLAYSDMMTIRLGYYMPNALKNSYLLSHQDSLWAIELGQMSMLKSDYRGSILGGGYEFFLTPQVSLAVSVDFFNRENGGYYKQYVGIALDTVDLQGDYAFPVDPYLNESDFEILHTFHVSMTPIQFSLKFMPLGRKTRIIPYVGGGGGAYFLSASIRGSIVDNSDTARVLVNDPNHPELEDFYIYPVMGANAHETRVVLGGHAFAGIMFPIGYRLTLEGEARYHLAKVAFQEAFPDYDKFDLSGLSLSIGLNYWF